MKENTKPFVHKFKTAKYRYVYDVNTNRVLRVGATTFQIIDEKTLNDPNTIKYRYPQYSIEEIEESLSEIFDAKEKGLFSSHRPNAMAFGS